jgi:hypothetical protein
MFVEASGHRWELLIRDMKINRAGAAPGNSLAAEAVTVRDVALTHEHALAWGNIVASLGYSDVHSGEPTLIEDGVRGFMTIVHAFR